MFTNGEITESRDFYLDGESGFRICKAFVGERVVYTLSRRGVLVRSSLDLNELKELADEISQRV